MADAPTIQERDWFTVLNAFHEENLSFEYTGRPGEVQDYKPHRDDLQNIDFPVTVQELKKAGLLEVADVHVSDPSVPFDSLTVIRLSEKGYDVLFEQQTREAQRYHNEQQAERQRQFERRLTSKQEETNSAIAYLTVGLLLVAALDLVQSTLTAGGFGQYNLYVTATALVVVALIVALLFSTGLLGSEVAAETVDES
ncbi:hypothetical protein ACFQL9_13295 [Halobaculum lipolyticum]|uniref:Uncharacterized protein n=1 Tax=Halobaculum lipolyticum TaxID=3032001 RepID=A0ABD5WFV5_9EURY